MAAQALDLADGHIESIDEDVLGDFEHELAAIDAAAFEQLLDVAHEGAVVELACADVDRELEIVPRSVELTDPAEHLPQGPAPHGNDQSALFGQRHEPAGRDRSMEPMLPAQQGLGSDASAVGVDDGLVEHVQLVSLECKLQVVLERGLAFVRRVRRRLIEADLAADLLLGPIHRRIRMAQQIVRRGALSREDRNADAGGQAHVVAGDLERLLQGPLQFLRNGRRALLCMLSVVGDIGQ